MPPPLARGVTPVIAWSTPSGPLMKNVYAPSIQKTADGLHRHKSPANPVLRPDPQRAWESHYVTSQSVMRIGKGRFRIWYASRRKPPFRNKYFALNTDV